MKSRLFLFPWFLALAGFVFSPSSIVAGPKVPKHSIQELQSRDTTEELAETAASMIDEWEERLEAAERDDDKDLEDDLEDALEILEYTAARLKNARRSSTSEREVYEANSYAERTLQTVREPVTSEFLPNPGAMLKNLILGSAAGVPLPRDPKRGAAQPVGEAKAKKEAANLFDPRENDLYTAEELAALSAEEIASLDVSPGNAFWYDRRTFRQLRPDPVRHFESFVARGMTEELWQEGDLKRGRNYPLSEAKRVLFLEKIYQSATSPKIDAEDAYGVEWKVKWGDEVAAEPVSSRLYLLAGAKMTDLVLSNGSGPAGMVLVLMDPEDAEEEREDASPKEERFPTTAEELAEGLKDLYGFDIRPYIHSQGIVTEANVDSVLRNLPPDGKKKHRKDKAIGRHWVAFRESSVELQTKGFIRRHDGARTSDHIAVADRAARGSFLFNLWISNRDAKSGNNKAFFIKELRGDDMEIAAYREGQHDLGLSLGSFWSAADVNELKTGTEFLRRGLFGRPRVQETVIFHPEAWNAATWSDCRWMAERMAAITEDEIQIAVAASGWPDFACEALAWKLLERREQLIRVFGLSTIDKGAVRRCPSKTLPLGNPSQVRAAERAYQLEPGSLLAELEKSGAAQERYRETVLRHGQIASCEDSALVRLLVRQRYPSGLSDRYDRTTDRQPDCLETEEKSD